MAIVRALFLSQTQANLSVSEIAFSVHKLLLLVSTAEMFVTVFYGIVEEKTRCMRYVRAGHDRPILYRAADNSLEELRADGRFVGLWPDLYLEEDEVTMLSGDTLVCYSDGVVDAENEAGEGFGLDRLWAVVAESGRLSAQEVAARITDAVYQFRGDTPETDDITIFIAKAV